MLAKCANPSCSTPLVYLREGKIFMMVAPSPEPERPPDPKQRRASGRVEHFWLCGPCSAEMTLAYDRQHGVRIVPKQLGTLHAAAS